MSYTIKIKNDSGATQVWAGKEFSIAEEYTVPTDTNRIKYQNSSSLIAAIGTGDALVGNGDEYFSDVSTAIDWLKGHDTRPTDTDGAPLQRTKITRSGWHYQCHSVELTSSKLSSVYNSDNSQTDLGFTAIKYYNSSGTELTAGTQTELDNNCTKTVVTLTQSQDVEVLGGVLYQGSQPTEDVRLWVMAVPDLPAASGGSVPFCQGGINLRHMGTGMIYDIDGKTPKLLPYHVTYHTNRFEITVTHPVGHQHTIMLVLKQFRENT